MPRLLVFNNYPLDTLWAEVSRGEAPDHLLFGVNHFAAAGWEVDLLPVAEHGWWQQVNQLLARARFPVPLGDLQQQSHALRRVNDCDLIYAPCQTQTHGLSYLRAIGLVKRPIVSLAHHPMNRGRNAWLRDPFLRWQLHGTDAFPSLSLRVAAQINDVAPAKSEAIPWGPDATFYRAADSVGHGVLAVGRTGRDFTTFGLGASATGVRTTIVCLQRDVAPEFARFGTNVAVRPQPDRGWMSYPALLREYASARALAIPLYRQDSVAGLSSLADALGMGKAVLMTRHPLVDLDIEREGVGRWIEPGDVDGWRDAITWIDAHPDEARAMGARARRLVAAGFNSATFAQRLLAIADRVLTANN